VQPLNCRSTEQRDCASVRVTPTGLR
jgi:hypothetical protein